MNLDKIQTYINNKLIEAQERQNTFHVIRDTLSALNIREEVRVEVDHKALWFWGCTHAEMVQIILAFPGTWRKDLAYDNQSINYTLIDGPNSISIFCYSVNPPPSCKIIREEVTVPETLVPEHREVRVRLECHEPDQRPESV